MGYAEKDYGNKTLMMTNFKRDGTLAKDDVATDAAPVQAVWDAFQRQIYERGARCCKLANDLDSITGELDTWIKGQQSVKKALVDESYKLKKELAEHHQEVLKTQAARDAACAEADKLLEAYLNSGKEGALKKKCKHAIQDAMKLVKDYKDAIFNANKYRVHFSKRLLPDLLGELKAFEETRVATMKKTFLRLQSCISDSAPSSATWVTLMKLIDDVNPEKISVSALQIGSSDSHRQPIEAIPFDAGFPDFGKSRLARMKGQEEVAPVTKSPRRGTKSFASSPNVSPAFLGAVSSANGVSALAATEPNPPGPNSQAPPFESRPSTHFAEVMPNTVVALGVESKREILRTQLSQLQTTILSEKRIVQDLISLIRFYGPGPAANRAREDYLVCRKRFGNLLGARKQIFAALEMIGTTPSVLSTLRKDRYATAPLPPIEKSPTEPILTTQSHFPPKLPVAQSAPVLESVSVKGYGLFTYKAATEKELSFSKYEVLFIRDMDESGWWYCENKSGVLGFCPANFLKPLQPGEEAPIRKKKSSRKVAQ